MSKQTPTAKTTGKSNVSAGVAQAAAKPASTGKATPVSKGSPTAKAATPAQAAPAKAAPASAPEAPAEPPADAPPADSTSTAEVKTPGEKKPKAKRAPAAKPTKPAFIPSAISSAIDHAGMTRLADLVHYFGQTDSDITITPCVCTVALANMILTGNVDNRPLNKPNFTKLSQRMTNGKWNWDVPIIIIIDTEGKVHNGQHTLNALITAEKTRLSTAEWTQHFADLGMPTELAFKNCVVIRGLPPSVADHWDTGKVRNNADLVFRRHLLVEENRSQTALVRMSTATATAAKFVYLRLVYGLKQRASKPFGHEDIVEFLNQYPGLVQSVEYVFDADAAGNKTDGKTKLSSRLTLPQAAVLHFLMSNAAWDGETEEMTDEDARCREAADNFISQVAFGGVVDGKDPVSTLCQWIAQHGDPNGGASNKMLEAKFDAALVAADAFLKGKTVTAADLTVPPEVQAQDSESHPLWTTSTGIEGFTDAQGSFHWFDEQGDEQSWTKATMKTQKVSLFPVTIPSYPHLGGLDVPPADEDEYEDAEDGEGEDPSVDADAPEAEAAE